MQKLLVRNILQPVAPIGCPLLSRNENFSGGNVWPPICDLISGREPLKKLYIDSMCEIFTSNCLSD